MKRATVLSFSLALLSVLPSQVVAQQQGYSTAQGQPMVGSGLMTPEEQEQLRERIRAAGSEQKRQAILDEHRLKMADRARAQGMNPESIEGLPSSSGDDPRSRQIRGQPTGAPQGGAAGPAGAPGMNTGPATGTGRGPQQPVPGQQDRAGGVR